MTLAECLERAETTDDIPKVLKSYQEIRGPRCNLVQEWSAIQCKRATMPDGPEQEQRDKNFKSANHWAKAEPWDGVHVDEPPPIDDSTWYAWLCGHDTVVFVSLN